MAELRETKVFVCWVAGWLIPARFQPQSPQLCLDAKGWRTAVASPMRGLASIYDYLHFALGSDLFACVCVPRIIIPVCMQYSKSRVCNIVSRLVEARCLVCVLRLQYLLSSPSV
jgi:hypothetical protein